MSTSFAKSRMKIVLLEGVHDRAVENFKRHGYTTIERHKKALAGDELRAAVADAYFVGIRSRTRLTADAMAAAPKLMSVGAFCIGTNQIDLDAAMMRGIPVFNAPFSNTRSVAELVLAEIIFLLRGIPAKNALLHRGVWAKSADDAREVRGKTLGIVGARMKKGAKFINASRGTVVDIDAAAEALETRQLAGAAFDVFPVEPEGNDEEFVSPLRRFDNVILTPHIAGSTLEAQANIGTEVSEKLVRYSDNGSTLSAVNFPEVALPEHPGSHRLLHIHKNVPGVLSRINGVFSKNRINISGEYLMTNVHIGYVVIDVEANERSSRAALKSLNAIEGTIRTRVLF